MFKPLIAFIFAILLIIAPPINPNRISELIRRTRADLAQPSATATATQPPTVTSIPVLIISDPSLPDSCGAPPPWTDFETALACHGNYPLPNPILPPHCDPYVSIHNYLICSGYLAEPANGWPTVPAMQPTITPVPANLQTPRAPYPSPNPTDSAIQTQIAAGATALSP